MGIVHLARSRRRPGRAQDAAPAHRRRRRGPGPAGPRGQLAEPDPQQVGRRDRRRRPVGADPVRRHPLRARPRAARPRRRGGRDLGRRPGLVRRLPRRGAGLGARGRSAAPRHQAVQRTDGGPHPDPDRLRAGPGRRRPEANPHRVAARHSGLPRSGDPVRRRRDRRLRRALLGGDRGLRRHRQPTVRARPVDGDHGPRTARRARPHRGARLTARRAGSGPRPGPRTPAQPRRTARLAAPADHPARRAGCAAPVGEVEDMFTVPLALAAQAAGEAETEHVPDHDHPGTLVLPTEVEPVVRRPPRSVHRSGHARRSRPGPATRPSRSGSGTGTPSTARGRAGADPVPWPERLRRATLIAGGAVATGAACAAAPWVAAALVVLRSGCCAAARSRPQRSRTSAGCAAASGTTAPS